MSAIFSSSNNEEVIEYLKQNSLLTSKFDCVNWNNETKFTKSEKRCRDGYGFRCSKCKNKPWYSIREKSFFFGLKLTLVQAIQIIFFWAIQQNIKTIEDVVKVTEKTIIKYFQILRELCIKALDKESMKIGGPGLIVEIDESLMAKVKHWKGL